MSDDKDIHAALDRLARENAELNGLALATGVILTQLLQSMTLSELNPQAAATRIVTNAQKAIEGFKPAQIDGSEARAILLKMRTGELNFEGQSYLLNFVLPNLFFHCTTAYNILREAGTDIGKTDFIGNP